MLGKLARWLRIIGYDTLYEPALDDASILELARKNDRLLITRDAELYRRAARENVPVVLVHTQLLQQELKELSTALGACKALGAQASKSDCTDFEIPAPGSRCPVCNGLLVRAERSEAAVNLSESALVWRCPSCGKVYWHGSHWRGINMTLHRLGFGELVDNS